MPADSGFVSVRVIHWPFRPLPAFRPFRVFPGSAKRPFPSPKAMVPRTRLIVWTALIVLPFSVLGATSQAGLLGALVAIGGFLLLVAADAITGSGRLRGLRVELPALTRLQKD